MFTAYVKYLLNTVILAGIFIACRVSRSYNGATMSDHDGILLEDINHKLEAILEGQQAMGTVPGDIAQLKDDMIVVRGDIKVIKAVVTNHERRITKLEKAPA
jgi:hypothetical protein